MESEAKVLLRSTFSRNRETSSGGRREVGERQEVYLAPAPGSVGASCQREPGMKKGRWSKWRVKRRAGGGCGETEKA